MATTRSTDDTDPTATETSQLHLLQQEEPQQRTPDDPDYERNLPNDECDAELERLLDRYPLRKSELLHLLSIFEQEHQQHHDVDPPTQGATSTNNKTSSLTSASWSSFLHDEARAILPELARVVQCALTTVFVVVVVPPERNSENNENHDLLPHDRERFLEALCSLLGRRGERIVWDILFGSFVVDHDDAKDSGTSSCVNRAWTEPLMTLVYKCAIITTQKRWDIGACNALPPKGWIQSLSEQAHVTRTEWSEWIVENHLYRCLPSVFQRLLNPAFDSKLSPPNFPLQWFPTKEAISMVAMGLQGPYRDLYDSDRDGLSFRIFQQALLGFHGPTLIWIRTHRGEELGYYTRLPWKSSTKWYNSSVCNGGNADHYDNDDESFLFRLAPNWNRYRQHQPGRKAVKFHQYLNVDRPDAALKGLAVGGVAVDAPRLYLTESLEHCRCASIDHLFAPGPLLGSRDDIFFDVDHLRVWAVCTEAEYEHGCHAGQFHITMREGVRQRLAQVDRSQFVEDIDLLTNLFEHRRQARGRADYVAHDDEHKGYYIQGKRPSLSS